MKKGGTKEERRQKLALFLAGVLLFSALWCPELGAASIDLGKAGPSHWALLALGGGGVSLNLGAFVSGSVDEVGVAPPVSGSVAFKVGGGASCPGDRYLGTNVTESISPSASVGNKISGPVADGILNQAKADALARSAFYAGLPATPGFPGTIKLNSGTLDLNGGHGLNVLNLSHFILGGGATVNFAGYPDTLFILNISRSFKTAGGSSIVFTGLSPYQVLFNFGGTNKVTIGASGAGILLAPYADVGFSTNVLWTGEVIAGNALSLNSGAGIYNPVPLPATWLLFLSGAMGAGLWGWRRREQS